MNTRNQGVKKQVAANDAVMDPANPYHPSVTIFRDMQDDQFEQLKASIELSGQLEPIATQGGKIIDGRHRYRACLELGRKPIFKEIDAQMSAIEYCVAENLHRRHLSDFDKAEAANQIGMLSVGSNQHTAVAGRSQGFLANLFETSADTLQRGKKIIRDGSPELQDAVRSGKISVTVGALLSDLPKEQQAVVANDDAESIAKVAKAINVAKKKSRRDEKVRLCLDLAANSPSFEGIKPCSVIYADPPWNYLGFDGTPYPTMPTDDICEMWPDIHSITTPDAVLVMCAPSAMLPDALKVIEAWGFEYKTSAVWDKQTAGQGVYFRQQHEFLLLATKGNPPCVDPKATPSSVISAKRGKHSEKPVCIYEMIEKMYPELGKLELFSRTAREGWTMWGNQAGMLAESAA